MPVTDSSQELCECCNSVYMSFISKENTKSGLLEGLIHLILKYTVYQRCTFVLYPNTSTKHTVMMESHLLTNTASLPQTSTSHIKVLVVLFKQLFVDDEEEEDAKLYYALF